MPTAHSTAHRIPADRFRTAYDRARPAMEALDKHEILSLNLDVPSTVTKALGVVPKLEGVRAEVTQALGPGVLRAFDLLEGYALALMQTQGDFLASAPTERLDALVSRATRARDALLPDVHALIARGHLDEGRFVPVMKRPGYRHLATALIALTAVLDDAWPRIEGKTSIDRAEIANARSIAAELLAAIATHDRTPAARAAAAEQRRRAFTLLYRAYDEVRRAVAYVRRDRGDVDAIVPSLYAGRRGRRSERVAGRTSHADRVALSFEKPVVPAPPADAPPRNAEPGAEAGPEAIATRTETRPAPASRPETRLGVVAPHTEAIASGRTLSPRFARRRRKARSRRRKRRARARPARPGALLAPVFRAELRPPRTRQRRNGSVAVVFVGLCYWGNQAQAVRAPWRAAWRGAASCVARACGRPKRR